VAVLLAAAGRWRTALNPAAVGRIARRQLSGTMVLHLALLVWLAAGLLATVALVFIRQALTHGLQGGAALAVRLGATAVTAFVLAAALQAAALIVGRCVGYFGLYHRSALQMR
jgi:Na+/H+ antiporter NhaB